jgi:hypothetical protein
MNWWHTYAWRFDLYISNEVIRELSDPGFPAEVRDPALAMLEGLSALELNAEVVALAEVLTRERVMPAPAVAGDASYGLSGYLESEAPGKPQQTDAPGCDLRQAQPARSADRHPRPAYRGE